MDNQGLIKQVLFYDKNICKDNWSRDIKSTFSGASLKSCFFRLCKEVNKK